MPQKDHSLISETKGFLVHVNGRVQGVGFRPFVYHMANKFRLKGYVLNRPDGVIVHIEGEAEKCRLFMDALRINCPPAARIREMITEPVAIAGFSEFKIMESKPSDAVITEICPDIALCENCLQEMANTTDRRYKYPFINCTNCGPRFTLIDDFPYDRRHTSMREFSMCTDCHHEYGNVNDRRFHAQPVSCPACGPTYKYIWKSSVYTDFKQIIRLIGKNLDEGKVVALKGLGGYNLACNALDPAAIDELRRFKKREKKPLAVMFRSIESVTQFAELSGKENDALLSWVRPIVILDRITDNTLPAGITAGLNSIGAFLPYLPLHYLLFEETGTDAMVLTSGNESDIPILYQEEKALEVFKGISGGILINNRKIARRIDDSVVKIIHNRSRIFRRARGYVPSPVDVSFDVEGILATGAELSNCFCIGKGSQAILSQHIGDLKNADTYEFFVENIREFTRMYKFQPGSIACDLHPDYLSTRYANSTGVPVIQVQHHHAHIASVMAEYRLTGPVIGISYDGTGYGTDGLTWGSEALIADYRSFERISHFEYVALPGGDKAVNEPWRSALSYLFQTLGAAWKSLPLPFLEKISISRAEKLIEAIDKKINSPLCCSAGRLFDAVAALLCICIKSDYHAQAPMLLENYINPEITGEYAFSGHSEISFRPMMKKIIEDILDNKSLSEIVTKFHNTIAKAAVKQVLMAHKSSSIKQVVLSGGTFQNKYLTEKVVFLLEQQHFEIFVPYEVPCNDGGIALGQIAVAAHNKE